MPKVAIKVAATDPVMIPRTEVMRGPLTPCAAARRPRSGLRVRRRQARTAAICYVGRKCGKHSTVLFTYDQTKRPGSTLDARRGTELKRCMKRRITETKLGVDEGANDTLTNELGPHNAYGRGAETAKRFWRPGCPYLLCFTLPSAPCHQCS